MQQPCGASCSAIGQLSRPARQRYISGFGHETCPYRGGTMNALQGTRSEPSVCERETYLAQAVHSPMIADPNNPITHRRALLGCRGASKRIVSSAVRDDRGRAALNDMYGHIESTRQSLDLSVSAYPFSIHELLHTSVYHNLGVLNGPQKPSKRTSNPSGRRLPRCSTSFETRNACVYARRLTSGSPPHSPVCSTL